MDPEGLRRAEGFTYLALFAGCIPLANWLIGNFGTFCAQIRDLLSLPLFRAKLASKAEPLPILHVLPRHSLRQHWTRQRRRDGQSRKQMWNLARSPTFSLAISPRRRQKWQRQPM